MPNAAPCSPLSCRASKGSPWPARDTCCHWLPWLPSAPLNPVRWPRRCQLTLQTTSLPPAPKINLVGFRQSLVCHCGLSFVWPGQQPPAPKTNRGVTRCGADTWIGVCSLTSCRHHGSGFALWHHKRLIFLSKNFTRKLNTDCSRALIK